MFGLFKRKDPVCGMKEQKGRGVKKHGNWFCSDHCVQSYEQTMKKAEKKDSCCH